MHTLATNNTSPPSAHFCRASGVSSRLSNMSVSEMVGEGVLWSVWGWGQGRWSSECLWSIKSAYHCQNVISKVPLCHKEHKDTAEEGIRLRDIFLSSAGYTNLTMLLPNKKTQLGALYRHINTSNSNNHISPCSLEGIQYILTSPCVT